MKYVFWLFLFSVFIVRFLTTQPNFKDGQTLKIKGTLYQEPSVSGSLLIFNLSGIKINLKTNSEIHYGDYVIVEGVYADGGLTKTKLDFLKISDNIFTKIRKHLINFYESSIKEPDASLIAGITIGAKSSLPYNFKAKLNNSGTSHIVVASGTNITIFGGFVLSLLIGRLSRKKTLIIVITSIWLYTFITGFEAPIIRAAIMSSIAFTAVIFGKVANSFRYILLTGAIILISVPRWITDVGFLLSFSTTLSIIVFSSKLNNLFSFLPEFIKEDFATTLAAQIGSFPIIYYFFGNFNLLSPIINVLVLWTVPIIMIVGGISGIVSFISVDLAKTILSLDHPLTAYFIGIVSL